MAQNPAQESPSISYELLYDENDRDGLEEEEIYIFYDSIKQEKEVELKMEESQDVDPMPIRTIFMDDGHGEELLFNSSPASSTSRLPSPSRAEGHDQSFPSAGHSPTSRSSVLASLAAGPSSSPSSMRARGCASGRIGRGRGRRQVGRGRGGRQVGKGRGGRQVGRGPGRRELGRGLGRRGSGRGHDVTLQEIYVTDDDVPEDLRAICKEYERRQVLRRKNVRASEDDTEFGGDAALFRGDEDSLNFDWRSMDSFQGKRESFLPQKTGPTAAFENVYDAFSQFWDKDILTHIVSETNRYAATLSFNDWYDTNIHEIMILFSFWMMLAIVRLPSIKSCFSEDPLLTTSCFKLMFSRHRYERLCSALNFNDITKQRPESSKVYPIEPILIHLNAKFQAAYIPRQEICIDESLTLWKGNLSIKQYINTKAAKYGIKSLELCESATGYLCSFFVYTGKDSQPDLSLPASLLKSTASVLRLIHPLLNKGYTLFIDGSFNSPLLARFLKKNKTDVVGTLRPGRQHVPQLVAQCTLQDGQLLARHSGDMTVMKYQDKKKYTLLSTYHGSEINQTRVTLSRDNPRWKPQLVLDYNKSMGGVDLKDGMLEAYLLERKKCSKWYMKVFKRLLNVSILNARICYEASIGSRVNHTVFRLNIVKQILDMHLNLVPKRHQPLVRPRNLPARHTTNRHWPNKILKRQLSNAGSVARRRCAMAGCKKLCIYECRLCNVGLCVEPCFGAYHNMEEE